MAKLNLSQNEVLDRFLANNPELEELSAKLQVFNVFRTLKVEQAEIRHSNVLAWLLDPSESHGLSDIVLRRILSNILLESNTNIKGISAAQVELMRFDSIEVRREWKNIDIVIVDRDNKFVVLIENKIYSKESKGQLAKYLKILNDEFPSLKKLPIFLTLMGDEVEDEQADDYCLYSYSQVLTVLGQIFSQRTSQLAEPVAIFLRQYIDILRKLTMQDEKLVDLCKTIYRKHRDAIDLIVEYGMIGAGPQAVESILAEDGDYEFLGSRTNEAWFIPQRWSVYIPENGTDRKRLNRPVSIGCYFYFGRNNPRVCLFWAVSAMDDTKLRLRCVNALQKAGFKLGKRAFQEDAKYSRFYSESTKVSDLTDQEEVSKAIRKLLNRAKDKFSTAEEVFKKVFKSS